MKRRRGGASLADDASCGDDLRPAASRGADATDGSPLGLAARARLPIRRHVSPGSNASELLLLLLCAKARSNENPLPAMRLDHSDPRAPPMGEPGCTALSFCWLTSKSSATDRELLDDFIDESGGGRELEEEARKSCDGVNGAGVLGTATLNSVIAWSGRARELVRNATKL